MPKNLEETLEQFSMNAIHLIGTENNVFTKIGGQPLANKNFEWPEWHGQSLAFIMQIKLSERTSLSHIKLFPQNGFLYLDFCKVVFHTVNKRV